MDEMSLNQAELRVWNAFRRGEVVDFRAEGEGADPEAALRGDRWDGERTVRAKVLRALLVNGPVEAGEIPRMRVLGARITGTLDLQYGVVEHPVTLSGCHFEETPRLYGAQVRQFSLSESRLPGLTADGIRVDGVLRLTGCHAEGPVTLGGARVAGACFLDAARLGAGPTSGMVLGLNHAGIEGDLWAPGLVARGQVLLDGAHVTGVVNLNDARLEAPGGTALQAETLTVGSDLHAMRLRTLGRVNLRGATVPGQLNLARARLRNPDGAALRASGCQAGEFWLREAAPIEGGVNLRRAHFGLLFATPDVWPDEVRVDELSYTKLNPPLPAARRLELLERDAEGYIPSAYEQLTASYRRIGDDVAARTVQLAKQRRHRATLPPPARLWGHLQDATVGYGFRPMRAAGWLAGLLLVGTVTYGLRPPRPLKSGEAPGFHALAYTLDLLLPIIDLGQEKSYTPDGAYQWLSYALVLAGWVLATTFAAGVTRVLSRQ
ncbi:membrane-associated oxidoreductase [Streptomyces sp. NPDC048172]|uniref:membrane-associated oxidoreductase n=1 Tax=Streptomyces sp. NPDC048172 TaxID=3365505 RepID=UPI00371C978E